MDQKTFYLLNEVNRSIIKFRGLYSLWSSAQGISYHEMLVLYTIREKGFCTQKQICENYLIPRQTINNVISFLRKEDILKYSADNSIGREKAFILTKKGEEYAKPLLDSMNTFEAKAVASLGEEKLEALTALMLEYDQALLDALEESRK